jgi:hypothetical protein
VNVIPLKFKSNLQGPNDKYIVVSFPIIIELDFSLVALSPIKRQLFVLNIPLLIIFDLKKEEKMTDEEQTSGNNSISIMSLAPPNGWTTPGMTVTAANSVFIGNMGVNKVTFGVTGLEFTWDADSVTLKVGSKSITFNLS